MIEALAAAFAQLAIVIAADWSSPKRTFGGRVVHQRITTPDEVIGSFVRLAADHHFDGDLFPGHIHPQWSHDGFMFGHWGF